MDVTEVGLKNKTAVIKEAKAIACYHLDEAVASAKECVQQGMFSRTVVVKMKSKSQYVVQLCVETVHEENSQQAHDILGDIVPVPTRVILPESPVPYTYIMPFIEGSTWYRARWVAPQFEGHHVKVAEQIGEIIGKCCAPPNKGVPSSIDTFIIPRLEMYEKWDEPTIGPFKPLSRNCLDRVGELKKLPLCWTHYDINMMNTIVDEDSGTLKGILDWEESYWMPLGINTCRIVELAADNRGGKLEPKSFSGDMEKAFWTGLFRCAPKEIRSLLSEMQLAMDIGMIMDTFFEAKNPPHPSHVGVLSDALATYCVPRDLSFLVYPSCSSLTF